MKNILIIIIAVIVLVIINFPNMSKKEVKTETLNNPTESNQYSQGGYGYKKDGYIYQQGKIFKILPNDVWQEADSQGNPVIKGGNLRDVNQGGYNTEQQVIIGESASNFSKNGGRIPDKQLKILRQIGNYSDKTSDNGWVIDAEKLVNYLSKL